MKRREPFRFGIFAIVAFCISSIALQAQVNVTTYHNDNVRTGQNSNETILTPANVNSSQFGKLFSVTVDGRVYAQALYLSNVSIAGASHNVLYVATEHDSLYAIDADHGTIYWRLSLIPAGGTTVNSNTDLGCTDLLPEIGITGTPVIDTTSGTIYLVAKSKVNGSLVQYLHAIDVATAGEKFGGPVLIQATVPGTAADGDGTNVSFNPACNISARACCLKTGTSSLAGDRIVISVPGTAGSCLITPARWFRRVHLTPLRTAVETGSGWAAAAWLRMPAGTFTFPPETAPGTAPPISATALSNSARRAAVAFPWSITSRPTTRAVCPVVI